MSTGKRVLVVAVAGLTVIVLGWVLLIGAVLASGGVAIVSIDERSGARFSVPVPLAVVDAALIASGPVIDLGTHLDAELDLGQWGPFVEEILTVLDECPDAVLVEVEDGEDHVYVAKEGRTLRVEVSDSDIGVKVTVPTRAVHRTVSRLFS
jgi:hypothetical protein